MNAQPIKSDTRFTDYVDNHRLDSPIEEEFYHVISKYLTPKVDLYNQYPAKVSGYNFSIDFVIICGNLRIGIECDGKAYHNVEKDEWRDKSILNANLLDVIIRFRGTDIVFRIHDALYAMSQWYPEVFSQRGLDNITVLATPTARDTRLHDNAAKYFYPDEFDMYKRELELGEYIDDKLADGFGILSLYRKRKGDR